MTTGRMERVQPRRQSRLRRRAKLPVDAACCRIVRERISPHSLLPPLQHLSSPSRYIPVYYRETFPVVCRCLGGSCSVSGHHHHHRHRRRHHLLLFFVLFLPRPPPLPPVHPFVSHWRNMAPRQEIQSVHTLLALSEQPPRPVFSDTPLLAPDTSLPPHFAPFLLLDVPEPPPFPPPSLFLSFLPPPVAF